MAQYGAARLGAARTPAWLAWSNAQTRFLWPSPWHRWPASSRLDVETHREVSRRRGLSRLCQPLGKLLRQEALLGRPRRIDRSHARFEADFIISARRRNLPQDYVDIVIARRKGFRQRI